MPYYATFISSLEKIADLILKSGIRVSLLSLSLALASSPSLAGSRYAIVFANQGYQHVGKLKNPVNDARLVAQQLERTKFSVTLALDLSAEAFDAEIKKFIHRIERENSDKSAVEAILVYYAGHAVQFDGENYLLPIDVPAEKSAIKSLGVSATSLISQINQTVGNTYIFIFDACRNNPFSTDISNNGLAEIGAGPNNYIVFSAKPGAVAQDGSGANSPFAENLSSHMLKQGIPIESVVRQVRKDVFRVTEGEQIPWDSSSLFDAFEFYPTGRYGEPELIFDEKREDEEFWRDAEKVGYPEHLLRKYLLLFPSGRHSDDARDLLLNTEALKELQ